MLAIATVDSVGYKLLLFLHILAVIVAFAPGFVWPMVSVALKKAGKPVGPTIGEMAAGNTLKVHGPALVLAGIFGFGLIGSSNSLISFSDAWVSAGMLVWFLIMGVVFGMMVPAEKKAAAGDEAAEKIISMAGGSSTSCWPSSCSSWSSSRDADRDAVHPIERLRFVARATGAPDDEVVHEAASSLAGFADDPVSLVTACRRLIDRHPGNGPIWWLCARVLLAADPRDEAWRCRDELAADPTVTELAHALPDGARAAVVGWPERLVPALVARGDVEVRVVDVDGDGPGFVRHLERFDVEAVDVPSSGLGPAVADADLVVLAASAIGPRDALVSAGSWAAAAVARTSERPVWLVGGRGRSIPRGLWPALLGRLGGAATAPWDRGVDLLPLELVDQVAGPAGLQVVAEALATVDTPDVAELRR